MKRLLALLPTLLVGLFLGGLTHVDFHVDERGAQQVSIEISVDSSKAEAAWRSGSVNATENASLVITTPAGAASGDVLYVACLSDNATNTITAPDGTWTSGGSYNTSDISWQIFYKVLSGAPAGSYTFTNNVDPMVCSMQAINTEAGTSVTVLPSTVGTGTPATNVATPNITNPADPKVFVACWGTDSGFTVTGAPSGMTIAHTLAAPGSYSLACYYQNNPSDVGNITRTLTFSGSDTMTGSSSAISWTAAGGGGSAMPVIHQQQAAANDDEYDQRLVANAR